MGEELREEEVMEKDFKEVMEKDFKEVMEEDLQEEMEEDLKEEMEEDFKEEMVVKDLEMVEDKEAMDPKIANILNVNRLMMGKITATSSQIVFGTINETENLYDIIL